MAMRVRGGRFEPTREEDASIGRVYNTINDALGSANNILLQASGAIKRNRAVLDAAGFSKEINDLSKAIEAINKAQRSWGLKKW